MHPRQRRPTHPGCPPAQCVSDLRLRRCSGEAPPSIRCSARAGDSAVIENYFDAVRQQSSHRFGFGPNRGPNTCVSGVSSNWTGRNEVTFPNQCAPSGSNRQFFSILCTYLRVYRFRRARWREPWLGTSLLSQSIPSDAPLTGNSRLPSFV